MKNYKVEFKAGGNRDYIFRGEVRLLADDMHDAINRVETRFAATVTKVEFLCDGHIGEVP